MAETVYTISSDSEAEEAPKKPLPKRRRYITSTAPIPVYSTKVQNSLKLLKNPTKLPDRIKERCNKNLPISSEDEDEDEKPIPLKQLKSSPRFHFSSLLPDFPENLMSPPSTFHSKRRVMSKPNKKLLFLEMRWNCSGLIQVEEQDL